MKKFACLFVILLLCASDSSASHKFAVSHLTEFGGVIVHCPIEEFNSLGFEFGDSVNLEFSNGKKLENIPYYNGYYSNIGETLVVGYPGSENVAVQINFGSDLWKDLNLNESDFVIVTLNSRGKYKNIQDARNIVYTNNRDDYSSDEVFANFRAINIGGLKKNFLYRSASPCDNKMNRASYVDALMKRAGIKCILNLADDEERIKTHISKPGFNSPYFMTLYENNCVILDKLSANLYSDSFAKKITAGLIELSKHEGPYLIHCLEGKDRTGFVCMLIAALAGASYDEMLDDYMQTYANYFGITRGDSKYNIIVNSLFEPMIKFLVKNDDIKAANFAECAERYLLDSGMTEDQLKIFKSCIM